MKTLPIYSPWIPLDLYGFSGKITNIKKITLTLRSSKMAMWNIPPFNSMMFPIFFDAPWPGFHFHGSSSSSLDTSRPSGSVQSRRTDQHWTPLGPLPDPNRASYLDTWPWSPEDSNHWTGLREDLHWKPGFLTSKYFKYHMEMINFWDRKIWLSIRIYMDILFLRLTAGPWD